MGESKNFRGFFNPSETKYVGARDSFTYFFRDILTIRGWLTLGAVAQTLVFLTLPTRLALLPVTILTLHSIFSTVIQVLRPRNDYNNDVLFGRATAQPPNPTYNPNNPDERPVFGSKPAVEPLVVFHLGFRSNHPLGPFAPGIKELGKHFSAMMDSLVAEADKYGLVGHSAWRAAERANHNSTMVVFYFRNVEALNAFAHDPIHRAGWDWYHSYLKRTGHTHIGIYHETFSVNAGHYETIYENMPPMLLGRTNWPVRNESNGKEEFVVPLVDCRTAQLRGQYNRLGRGKVGSQEK
ncbi:hypothetical protein DL546_001956 [Coniochaeta pulveracea]|uniref:Monooxygenase n=1 Tax=Coniochaeta pulveracea TaxID=177199 RepID=A0A420YME9_9PEZI|nr:hypothetical protein DL546_001956 [Coniochaeta pulveracea]